MVNIENYNKTFGNYLQIDQSDLVTGAVYLGNNFKRANDYYGGYQGNYLKRIAALFPVRKSVLHLYAGMIDDKELLGDKIDINPMQDGVEYGDARELSKYTDKKYSLIVADPPYSGNLKEYRERYGCKAENLNVKMVFREMYKVTTDNAWIVWLDWSRPFYRGCEWKERGAILYRGSTGHKDRTISLYQRA